MMMKHRRLNTAASKFLDDEYDDEEDDEEEKEEGPHET
jgi:hypothetical protein